VKPVAICHLIYTSISFSVSQIRNGWIVYDNVPNNPGVRCSLSIEEAQIIFEREDSHGINQLLAIDGNDNFV
jgi:hypothetical protein